MAKAKNLIIDADGFVGSQLTEFLVRQEHDVRRMVAGKGWPGSMGRWFSLVYAAWPVGHPKRKQYIRKQNFTAHSEASIC